jgi:hypothetical protein
LGSFLWYRPGLSQCRFRTGYIGRESPNFLRPKPDLLPAKAVLLPSQTDSTTAPHQPWDWCCGPQDHVRQLARRLQLPQTASTRPLLGKLSLLCDELQKAVPVCVSNGMRMKKLGQTVREPLPWATLRAPTLPSFSPVVACDVLFPFPVRRLGGKTTRKGTRGNSCGRLAGPLQAWRLVERPSLRGGISRTAAAHSHTQRGKKMVHCQPRSRDDDRAEHRRAAGGRTSTSR